MYVDPERCIYQKLGMKTEERFTDSGKAITVWYDKASRLWDGNSWIIALCLYVCVYLAHPSPHVKSGMFMGQMKSIWRAMTSPVFDFQGDLHQQGGAIIAGPGKISPSFSKCSSLYISVHAQFLYLSVSTVSDCIFSLLLTHTGSQVHFSHFDTNRLDHMPINWLLQLAGVQQTLDFSDRPKIIHV